MASFKSEPRLGAPIPGMSLTSEPGNRPWEKPPRIVDIDEAISFYVEKLTEPETAADILDKVEEGIPLALMADMFQAGAVAKGIHSIDVGIIVSPVIIEVVKAMAEDSDISYVIGTEKEAQVSKIDRSMMKKAISEVLSSEDMAMDMAEERIIEGDAIEDESMAEEPVRSGLMARKAPAMDEGEI